MEEIQPCPDSIRLSISERIASREQAKAERPRAAKAEVAEAEAAVGNLTEASP